MTDKLTVPCPNCGHKKQVSLDDITHSRAFVCSKCKKRVEVDGRKLKRDLDKTLNSLKLS